MIPEPGRGRDFMDQDILARLQGAMIQHDLDALVAYSKENVAYGAGYTVPSQALGIRNRQFAVAVNNAGRAAMLLSANELPEAQARSTLKDLRPYDEFAEDPIVVLGQILKDLDVAEGRIGLELDAVPADRWEALKRQLPRATWIHGAAAFHDARKVKTPRELERIRQAVRITELAEAEAHALVTEGMTEQDLYRLIVNQALVHGAETVAAQVAAGERSTFSNPVPSARELRSGDVVKIDIFVSMDGYLSDTGRSIVVGKASARQRDLWAKMQETLLAIHRAIRPGVHTVDLWRILVERFAKHGMAPSMRFLGHGLGLSFHEEPFIAEHTDAVLEPGMVLAIEPVFNTNDGMGFHLEDNVIVTSQGEENMTSRFGPDLIVVG
jgi:Xaa-Pro aminopeptidase